jgi:hypothetical protein
MHDRIGAVRNEAHVLFRDFVAAQNFSLPKCKYEFGMEPTDL